MPTLLGYEAYPRNDQTRPTHLPMDQVNGLIQWEMTPAQLQATSNRSTSIQTPSMEHDTTPSQNTRPPAAGYQTFGDHHLETDHGAPHQRLKPPIHVLWNSSIETPTECYTEVTAYQHTPSATTTQKPTSGYHSYSRNYQHGMYLQTVV